jgi:hypothetical protein
MEWTARIQKEINPLQVRAELPPGRDEKLFYLLKIHVLAQTGIGFGIFGSVSAEGFNADLALRTLGSAAGGPSKTAGIVKGFTAIFFQPVPEEDPENETQGFPDNVDEEEGGKKS